tara:strand:+ start:1298 stop:1582 length:285 start_codon:yes stop_codon:yes gene_type:complete
VNQASDIENVALESSCPRHFNTKSHRLRCGVKLSQLVISVFVQEDSYVVVGRPINIGLLFDPTVTKFARMYTLTLSLFIFLVPSDFIIQRLEEL